MQIAHVKTIESQSDNRINLQRTREKERFKKVNATAVQLQETQNRFIRRILKEEERLRRIYNIDTTQS